MPKRFVRYLPDFEVFRAQQMGWAALTNGHLIAAAEAADFDAIVTVDAGISHQQNLTGRRISIIVVSSPDNKIESLLAFIPAVRAELSTLVPGRFLFVPSDQR